MASTFANPGCAWRVRVSGDELNGGGFDAFISGSGASYADQDAPQWSSTTGTCAVAAATTFIDNSMTFTSDIVGNVLRSSARTGGTAAALDYFVITGFTDSHTLTLDRAMAVTTDITALTYRIGGAFASLKSFAVSATGTLGTPTLASPVVAGNTIYIRGDGSLDPGSATYDYSGGTWVMRAGSRTGNGPIRLVGYNGRPRIDHCGSLFGSTDWAFRHLSLFRKLNTNAHAFHWSVSGSNNALSGAIQDCIVDQNGFDTNEWSSQNSAVLFNEFRNTGGGAAGTVQVIALTHPSVACIGNYCHGLRGPAIKMQDVVSSGTTFADICYNYVVNCLSDGIVVHPGSNPFQAQVHHNTVDGNGGNGIVVDANCIAFSSIFNNILSNNTGAGLYFADSYTTNRRFRRSIIDANCYWQNGSVFNQVAAADTWVLQANDLTVDPGYTNRAAGNYATGTGVLDKGISGLGGVAGTIGGATNKVNIGAFQGLGAATAITLTGPSIGKVGVASTNFTIGANGSITGTVTITPTSSTGTGSFTPSTVQISSGTPTNTFTYTPTSSGSRNINETNDGGLSAPANVAYAAVAAALTGTIIGAKQANIVTGGNTIILTLTSDTWVASGATFNAQRQAIINGLTSAQAEAHGWNAEVRDKEVVGAVVRTSNTVVTITLTAAASYLITAQETITVTIPSAALTSLGASLAATPTFVVSTGIGGISAGIGVSPDTGISIDTGLSPTTGISK